LHFLRAVTIRPATPTDADAIWRIFQKVVAPGDTYSFAADTTQQQAVAYFLGEGITCFVAEDGGLVIGMYKLIPNRIGRGSHVANASFMVDPASHRRGAGRALGEHCLDEARRQGYTAMQFNFVVSTNTAGVSLWKKLGFEILGTLPKAFRHATLGDVDAYVMHRFL
jgi:ribosomal protein S18 acetylase RimI-like enzyme